MTKRNLTLGNASGKLGSVVYMRRRGQQVARVLIPSPRDPKSQRQGVARAHFANYVNLWRLLSPYIGVTWRGVSRYGTAANAFYKMNVGRMPAISKSMSRDGYAFPNLGLVTYGTLSASWRYEHAVAQVATAPNERANALAWLGNVQGSSVSKWGDVSAALIKANPGLQEGDVVHFLMMAYILDPDEPIYLPSGAQPRLVHYSAVLDLSDEEFVEDALPLLQFSLLPAVANYQQMAVSGSSSFYNTLTDSEFYFVTLASWVERPRSAGFSRYTRSSFVFGFDDDDLLRGSAGYSPISIQYGNTFRNV